MKALAFHGRGENKDAYDIVYLLQNYGTDLGDVTARLAPLLREPEAREAIRVLGEAFGSLDSTGPRRASEFLHGARNDEAEADAWGVVRRLLESLPD
jgi:hypothetical protein